MDEFEKELKIGFLEEISQRLTDTEECFLSLESNPEDKSLIEKIFRLAHNIKGSARAVGYLEMGEFTHELESLLLKIKNGEIKIKATTVSILLACNDHLKDWVARLSKNLNEHVDSKALLEKVINHAKNQDAALETATLFAASLVEEAPALPDATVLPLKKAAINSVKVEESIRVGVHRLEDLMNYVGELVILQTVLSQQKYEIQSPLIQKTITQLTKITKDIQDISMGLRMLPLKQTFQKVQRIVRDTANTLGKEVNFHMEGEDTELDKTVIENLGDPLVHLIRNAVDHGIEAPDARRAKGKESSGNIYLKAFHSGGRIFVEIRDDGKGLDPSTLKKKAIEKGILNADQEISDLDAQRLIFSPGFTTKSEVTEISGRGVGMDVVKTNIEKNLRGEVSVTSEVGQGTQFLIQLPLTLAIIEGIIINEKNNKFIVPLSHVHESVRIESGMVHEAAGLGHVLSLRGEQLPLLRLGQLLRLTPGPFVMNSGIAIIVKSGNSPFAISVDDIVGQHQVVIKSLGEEIKNMKGVMGGAILGDGKVALILDLQDLVSSHKKQNRPLGEMRGAA
ncbi:MAG: chemotaxis protein CheA [Bdellovibrionaceae bacterium]|nr:chemotaxis protein CheA [Pseudobdellovibrionaceae bacterium]